MGQPGGGPLPPALVQPLIATLTAAALRATVRELGDALLSLPGLGNDSAGLPTGGDDADDFGSAMGVSQADAVGASDTSGAAGERLATMTRSRHQRSAQWGVKSTPRSLQSV